MPSAESRSTPMPVFCRIEGPAMTGNPSTRLYGPPSITKPLCVRTWRRSQCLNQLASGISAPSGDSAMINSPA